MKTISLCSFLVLLSPTTALWADASPTAKSSPEASGVKSLNETHKEIKDKVVQEKDDTTNQMDRTHQKFKKNVQGFFNLRTGNTHDKSNPHGGPESSSSSAPTAKPEASPKQ